MWIQLLVLASVAPDSSCGNAGPLVVHGQAMTGLVGEKRRLAWWSNRVDEPLRYEWRLVEHPAV